MAQATCTLHLSVPSLATDPGHLPPCTGCVSILVGCSAGHLPTCAVLLDVLVEELVVEIVGASDIEVELVVEIVGASDLEVELVVELQGPVAILAQVGSNPSRLELGTCTARPCLWMLSLPLPWMQSGPWVPVG